ncbi:bifunctional [glutamine synthetase] adenylyltransferase/[glutamine synthetase]-adenylyl-L-tyrosine phosphorylase [Jiangella asiatica]|uniref:Bifunctional glutamine synthetase adenylyltransferase/adenylyl-removing enzyme n=1 Tax=Jiangella asiatica TaxID=2530372 RepID=A0A4R5DJG2_9ACTN|nr:bifunctional [glutamine synthetase] adenylyltransferase/[glutamine synthetase]-adenylyl-L-tyrosine phosphorylase [Jiangella asiatica]TDE13477.1 bifunctional [glutamine synthetase] adenylyltransferase/[glutamine synthetase]-adenylyl-L-tyrosine phosphorylase [Jiangella asiatica]
MSVNRTEGRAAWLAKAGFADTAAAERELDGPLLSGIATESGLVAALGATADPDLGLRGLSRLLEALAPGSDRDRLVAELAADTPHRRRLLAVLGFSSALADHLCRHPAHWLDLAHLDPAVRPDAAALRRTMLEAVGADPAARVPLAVGDHQDLLDALRTAYRRHVASLAALDLGDGLDVAAVAAELADLAGATLEAALAVARAELPPSAPLCRLAVIAMGKAGGRELNYASDVDVVFVAEPPVRPPAGSGDDGDTDDTGWLTTATTLATAVMRNCSVYTAEGTVWPVDAALRPEGKAGPLVRTVASHVAYYHDWAKTWEFQALLKARPVAGDAELGAAYVDAVMPMVWDAASRDGFVDDVHAMRRRVEDHIRPAEADRQLKLGPGGLRDVEFAVQLLQLVHGRADPTLRDANTLAALAMLTKGGYVGREDGAVLDAAYRFLRTFEHRIQLRGLRRTHVVPDSDEQLRILARSLGKKQPAELDEIWHQQAREVRRLHEKLFYRPLLSAVARLPGDEARLSPEAALTRLEALGYADPAGALRHIEALTTGVSRRAAIQRTLLPVLLGWFADAPEPDTGLAGFRKVSDALGTTPWYLRLLRDDGAAAERMARVLASGRYATELLLRAPEAVAMLGDDAELRPRERKPLEKEVLSGVQRHDDPVAAIGVVRAMRRRELFRVTVADLAADAPIEEVGEALTVIAEVTLSGALAAAVRAVEATRGAPLPTRVGVVAMGRLGGREMGYASDADVLYVHTPYPDEDESEAANAALAVANEMTRLLSLPSPEPSLTIDAALRPEGRQGPLVRTLASYAAYYDRWGEVWERQALLRAAPCCGDAELLRRFQALIDPLRWPSGGLTDAQVREVRRVKARVESERLPRGADPSMHLKLGPGGLADVEWCAQLLQLRHAWKVPELRTTSTPGALEAATAAGLLAPSDRTVLLAAWRQASAIRNTTVLVTGRPSDMLPKDPRTLAAVSQVLGYAAGQSTVFVDDYHRAARQARAVVERIFYDDSRL